MSRDTLRRGVSGVWQVVGQGNNEPAQAQTEQLVLREAADGKVTGHGHALQDAGENFQLDGEIREGTLTLTQARTCAF